MRGWEALLLDSSLQKWPRQHQEETWKASPALGRGGKELSHKYWSELAKDAVDFVLDWLEEQLPEPRTLSKREQLDQLRNMDLGTMMMIAQQYGPEEVARLQEVMNAQGIPQTPQAGV